MQFMTPPDASKPDASKARGNWMIVYHGNSDPVFPVKQRASAAAESSDRIGT